MPTIVDFPTIVQEALTATPFNMWVEVAMYRLYAVGLRNCRKASETKMTVIHRRSGCSSSNSDVERGGVDGLRRSV